MKRVLIIVILLVLASFTFAQTNSTSLEKNKVSTVADSALIKKYTQDRDILIKNADTLQSQITAAQKDLEKMKGQIDLLTYYIQEEQKKLTPPKKEDKKE